MTEQNTLAWVK